MERRYYKMKPNPLKYAVVYQRLLEVAQVFAGERARVTSLDGTHSMTVDLADLEVKYVIKKRTFEAKKYPVGSPERMKLNEDSVTSEYMPSHKYSLKGDHLRVTFRTKFEAELFVTRSENGLRHL
jgi:hypothetical protein